MDQIRNVIVIGASAGGIPAIDRVVKDLPADIDAAVIVVLHVSHKSNSTYIANIFQKNTTLTCTVALDGANLQKGHLYVAPPGQQLIIKDHSIKLTRGPHENKYRPSIDVLFRSVAVTFGYRAIGVILTGLLEDGTAGMHAIKRSGGLCIIQDPGEAQYSDMPLSVLNKIKVDHQARLNEIPGIIKQILNNPLPPEKPVPQELKIEADITEKMMSDIDQIKKIADHSDFTCPDCGGGLWKVKNDPVHRYRCHTGHVYTEKLLGELQDQNIEESVWVSIRMLEEKENLLQLTFNRNSFQGHEIYRSPDERLLNIRKHIVQLKSLLTLLSKDIHEATPTVDS